MAQANDKKYLFEEMPAGKALYTMAVPMIISQLINLLYNIVDTMFIGQTGDSYKTASVTLVFTIYFLTMSFANLFGVGGGSLIARLSGRGEEDKAGGVSAFAFYGAIGIALAYSLLIGLFTEPILYFLGASENTIVFAKQYVFLVVILGNTPIILSLVISHLLRNVGYSKQSGFGLSLGGILNIALDPLFMFVLLPKGMEVVGAALATLIAHTISCIYLIIVLVGVCKNSPLSMDPRKIKHVSGENLKSLFSVGVPAALLSGLFDVANAVLNSLMAAHGDAQLAAIGIVMKIERLPNAINGGMCQGMLPIVAYNYSSGNHKRMKEILGLTRKIGLGISIFGIAFFEVSAPLLCKIFMNTKVSADPAIAIATVTFAAAFLRIRCLMSPFQFLNFSTSVSMQAVGYGSGTLVHAVFRELVFYIPFMYVLNYAFGLNGLASAVVLGEAAGAGFAIALFARWKKKHVVEG